MSHFCGFNDYSAKNNNAEAAVESCHVITYGTKMVDRLGMFRKRKDVINVTLANIYTIVQIYHSAFSQCT